MSSTVGEDSGPAVGGPPETASASNVCANCGATLTGPYCSQCGQRHHTHPVHSLRHFIQEATEDLTHADSRVWRTTSALLLQPGYLTEEFLAGHRVRYLPPVRLYLVVSILFFLLISLQSWLSPPPIQIHSGHGRIHYRTLAPPERIGSKIRQAGATLPVTVPMRRVCQSLRASSQTLARWCTGLSPRIQRNWAALNSADGIERFDSEWLHDFERAMFLFLPLMALVMVPLYRHPRRYYVEHLLFLVHNQVFLFMAFGLYTLLAMIGTPAGILGWIGTLLWVYAVAYFYLALRRVYRQSRWRTIGKLAVLSLGYLSLLGLMFVVVLSYGLLTL